MPTPEQLTLYQQRLAAHDWYFEYSDDQSVWLFGRAKKQELEYLQEIVDPDFTTWNRYAPEGFQRKQS